MKKHDPDAVQALQDQLDKLDEHDSPSEELYDAWRAFNEISNTRRLNVTERGVIYDRITYSDVRDWCNLSGIDLSPWEVSALMQVDTIWWNREIELLKQKSERG